MNHSFYSADRSTHLKIVTVALLAGFLLAGFGVWSRDTTAETGNTHTARLVKAGKPVMITSSDAVLIR